MISPQLEEFDSQRMHETYDRWPALARQFYRGEMGTANFDDVDHVAFAGMGGSGTIGDVFAAILSKEDVHVSIVKGYVLPKTVDAQTLVVVTSVSGDTSETLTILEDAARNGIRTVSFASGGKIEEFCGRNNLPFYKIPRYHSPRASLVPFLYCILNILEPLLPIRRSDVEESIKMLEETRKGIYSGNLSEGNESLELARWIDGIPAIYYPLGLESAAVRFKNSLQENAKIHALAEDIIETTHNGIVSYEGDSAVRPVLVRGVDDHPTTKKRWDVVKEFFEMHGIEYREVLSVEGGILSKLINLIYVLDYASIYLAVSREVDPTPVKSIEFIKDKMS